MKIIPCTVFLIVLMINLSSAAVVQAQGREALVYTAVSVQDREATIAAHRDVVTALSNALSRDITIDYEIDHRQVVVDFINGKIDIAYFGSLPYVAMARRYNNYEILAAVNEDTGRPWYRCTLVRAFDGPTDLDKLKGSIALTNPLSTCGYLSVSTLLQQHNLDLEKIPYYFIGTHDDVALAVIRGEYAVGGVKDIIARKYEALLLEVMATTPLLPGSLLVANRETLSDAEIALLRTALTNTHLGTYETWGIGSHGFSSVDHSDYARIDEMMSLPFEWMLLESGQ